MDITHPIATPALGGMVSSTLYVLFLIPCLFVIGHDVQQTLDPVRVTSLTII